MILRPYQQRAIDQLYEWFLAGNVGHPCLVMPTGSGKSVVIAALCQDAIKSWPGTRILMATHVKELIEQNAARLRAMWPNAPMGIYSASVGRKELGEPITFAGIQSVRGCADRLGRIDLMIVDEAHLISHKAEGGYRHLIAALTAINPGLRVIGLTATPWRLGHGRIVGDGAIFSDLIEPVSIEELVYHGHLAPLRSKRTDFRVNMDGVHVRGGEFVEAELQAATNTASNNSTVCSEIIARANGCRSWLLFCAGVDHSEEMAAALRARGISAASVTGEMSKAEREATLADFAAGNLRAVTNANILTTGFDFPGIDLVAMVRATKSPSLYAQMAGRGMRPKTHTDHCLVLDFVGNIDTHGPVTHITEPRRKGSGGDAPIKICDTCGEICHASVRKCPACDAAFPEPEAKEFKLRDDIDIMTGAVLPEVLEVEGWNFFPARSQASGLQMIRLVYRGALSERPVTEYLTVYHDGYAGTKARKKLAEICQNAGIDAETEDLDEWCRIATNGTPPRRITHQKEGKFSRVVSREWA